MLANTPKGQPFDCANHKKEDIKIWYNTKVKKIGKLAVCGKG
ncbi:unnamed protein product, partial [marine sediment metagenome]